MAEVGKKSWLRWERRVGEVEEESWLRWERSVG